MPLITELMTLPRGAKTKGPQLRTTDEHIGPTVGPVLKSLLCLETTTLPRKQLTKYFSRGRGHHELHELAFFRAARVPSWLLGILSDE